MGRKNHRCPLPEKPLPRSEESASSNVSSAEADFPSPRSGDLLLPPSASGPNLFHPSSSPTASIVMTPHLRRLQRLHRYWIFALTFLCYVAYHASRKPLSVVKNVLNRNCTALREEWLGENSINASADSPLNASSSSSSSSLLDSSSSICSWSPFDGDDFQLLLGSLDYAFLFSYSIGLFFSGHIGERLNIKYFLGVGMLLCSATTCGFGLAYFLQIHSLPFLLLIQIVGGLFQSTGWPSIIAIMGNWFGKRRRGFIMGVWNAHTSIGNILGSLLAAIFVSDAWTVASPSLPEWAWVPAWGWSFAAPGLFIGAVGLLVLGTLVVRPADVGLPPPVHHVGRRGSCSGDESGAAAAAAEADDRSTDESVDSGRSSGSSSSRSSVDGEDEEEAVKASFFVGGDEEKMELEGELMEMEVATTTAATMTGETERKETEVPIGFCKALMIPGVLPFSTCLFFAKLVSYTFLFWLPNYIKYSTSLDSSESALLSTVFDLGGIAGGVVAGLAADLSGRNEVTCVAMLFAATPTLVMYQYLGCGIGLSENIVILIICGLFINGPYALITTAVSADLGTHKSLSGNTKALATVSAIIDGAGSMGAAVGPLLTGVLTSAFSWHAVFYMLIAANVFAVAPLVVVFVRRCSSSS